MGAENIKPNTMELGFIGLGKMGFNMVQNLLEHNYKVTAFDISSDSVEKISKLGAKRTSSLENLINSLPSPRLIWLMVPAGAPVDETINSLLPLLSKGDILIDGGNSYYKDTLRRAELLDKNGIKFFDVGTSGGLTGARNGACMMIGGDKETFANIENLFKDLCVENGYGYVGKTGSGHFVKMVHNGVEYGMMQAIGEGFDLLGASGFDLNLEDVSKIWANGSVIRGWLMDLTQSAFAKDSNLDNVTGQIADSGEGKWTVEAALDFNVAIPVIANSLLERYRSRTPNTMSNKVVAALRNEFGGHGFLKQ